MSDPPQPDPPQPELTEPAQPATHDDRRFVEPAVLAAGLRARYEQPHRCYHTLAHVQDVMRRLADLSPPSRATGALQLAAWFHDAIYAPGRDDNEARSAHLAQETLQVVGASPSLGTEVARLIALTAHHQPDEGDAVGAVLCDADLAILAAPRQQYDEYASAIRQEYSLVPDDAFRLGRLTILRAILSRDAVFSTETGKRRWESDARNNIEREIRDLTDQTHE